MKYTVVLIEDGVREKLVVESRGDLPRHVALKLLAYILYRTTTDGLPLVIERPVGQRHKPDLVATEVETGRVVLWIDCGQIETERLGRIASRNAGARVVVVKATEREARRYAELAERDLPPLGRSGSAASVDVLGFDESFVDGLVSALRGTNTLHIERTPEHVALTLGDSDSAPRASTVHVFSLSARTP